MITTFLPILYNNLPPIIGSFRFLWAPLWIISIMAFCPKVLFNKLVFYLLIYGFVFLVLFMNTIWIDVREWDKSFIINEYYYFFIAISIISYFFMTNDLIGIAKLTKWTLLFIAVTAIMSIYSSFIDPMYARNLIGGSYSIASELNYFKRLGGGEYSFGTALVCLFPVLVYYYKNNTTEFSRKTILLFGGICFLALIRMQIIANLLMSTIIIILSLIGVGKFKTSISIIIIVTTVFVLLPVNFYIDILLYFSEYFDPKSHTYFKLNDMAQFLGTGKLEGTGTGARMARYPLLIEAFLRNPIFGYYVTKGNVDIGDGGHLYWINRLTVMGIFGFIPYLFIHYKFIKSGLKKINKNYSFYFLLSGLAIVGIGLMKNIAGRQLWFAYFILLPGLYFLPLLNRKDKKL